MRQIGRLSALKVKRLKKPGLYPDGGNLYLQISETLTKSWIFRFARDGVTRDMGLGALHTVSLAEARPAAEQCRKLLLDGIDPIENRRDKRATARLDAARAMTFDGCAEAYISAHESGWRNAKHAAQWRSTLTTYASPVFGRLPVQSIDVALVMKVLEPIWSTKTETASRVRGRIESVLDWATARGYRHGDNPARWRGHLQNLLPRRSKVQRVEHHAALPYPEIGEFMHELRAQEGVAANALEFLIMTATRTSETIGTTWEEIDLENGVWAIPPARIKTDREHKVPLSPPAKAVLRRMNKARRNRYVFPGVQSDTPLSNMAMLALLKRMKRNNLTVHGFRSTFRDWAAEQTNYPRDVAEMALAHAISDKVEAAYRRGDLFKKRQRLMAEWGRFCGSSTTKWADNVTPMTRKRVKA